jgi:hypothetical protein
MASLEGRMKGQPALEFLSIYAWILITILLLVVVVAVLASSQSRQSYPPSHCYITISFPCYGIYVMTNSIGSVSLILFNNVLGTTVSFPNNAFAFNLAYTGTTYYGQCVPVNAVSGATVACNATLPNYHPSLGIQLDPSFVISYKICGTSCSGTLSVYNSSGSGTLTVSPYVAHFRNFVELASPPGLGTVMPGNGTYQYGSSVPISANAIPGHTFIGWSCTGVGCYNGTLSSASVTVSNYVVEVAHFK